MTPPGPHPPGPPTTDPEVLAGQLCDLRAQNQLEQAARHALEHCPDTALDFFRTLQTPLLGSTALLRERHPERFSGAGKHPDHLFREALITARDALLRERHPQRHRRHSRTRQAVQSPAGRRRLRSAHRLEPARVHARAGRLCG